MMEEPQQLQAGVVLHVQRLFYSLAIVRSIRLLSKQKCN